MKKLSLALSFVLILVLFTGCAIEEKLDRAEDRAEAFVGNQEGKVEQYLESATETPQTTLPEEAVTKEQAENIALEYAGLTREQVTGLRTEYEVDDGVSKYDIVFRNNGWEYEFEIHEKTGKILSYDKDQERR